MQSDSHGHVQEEYIPFFQNFFFPSFELQTTSFFKRKETEATHSFICTLASHLSSFACFCFQYRPPFHHFVSCTCAETTRKKLVLKNQDLVTNIMDLSEAPEEAKVGTHNWEMNSDARFEKNCLITISMFLGYWYKFSPKRNILLTGIVVV